MSPYDLQELRQELSLIPKLHNVGKPKPQPIVVFRENEHKIYIPRFYALERYRTNDAEVKSEISPGETIDCHEFQCSLRDYQQHIVDIYLNHVSGGCGGGILEVPCGYGKTVMAIYIVSVLKLKTLVLVHKTSLLNQWVERVQQFLPGLRIGIIQGAEFDIDEKDIVFGMIQTMYSRDYGPSLDSFGLLIIDEVHRIGSEEFSKTLRNLSVRYMLGISATVDRKDGLTDLLHMFIGPRIYSQTERTDDSRAIVRVLRYVPPNDPEYAETEYDYKGDPLYSRMIAKICQYKPRSYFIVDTLNRLRKMNPRSQILVLAHNLSLLCFLYKETSAFATVGYYKGGMKEEELNESKTKQIILGSYAMASEGMDIPTLSTLVLATPRTDIVQCVGRILRTNHGFRPTIVDIVDVHKPFQNQWKKRRAYYGKCNYEIVPEDDNDDTKEATCQVIVDEEK